MCETELGVFKPLSKGERMEAIIEQKLDWSRVLTKKGDTQNSERYYISVILEVIDSLGGKVGSSAGSQQSVDIRDVQWPDGTIRSYEGKKVNKGSRFIFNDTFLKDDVWYIFLYVETQKVRIAKGSTLIEESRSGDHTPHRTHLKNLGKLIIDMLDDHDGSTSPDKIKSFFSEVLLFLKACVLSGAISYFDFGQMFKQTVSFGSFVSRPRPNWSLTIPYKPPSQLEGAPHSPTEQSVPSENLPVDSPVETPVSP